MCLSFAKKHLKLVQKDNKITIKNKMNILMKKLLDKDIRLLIKTGYLDNCLNLTDKGKQAVNSLVLLAYKKELVEMAQEEVDESKK